MKKILGPMRRAIQTYNMIKPNEKIAIGLSGGKDSMALLTAMARYQKFSPIPFDLCAITVDQGFEGSNFQPLIDYCKDLGVEYHIKETQIGKIVFDVRKEKNPCALCANLKRGALHNAAIEHGAHTIALGHHQDDAVETFLMSLFFEGRINCFSPVTYLDRKDITLIRPLIYVKERDIKFNPNIQSIPKLDSNCPADGFTKRQEIKDLVQGLRQTYPNLDDRILRAIENKDQLNLWFDQDGLKVRK